MSATLRLAVLSPEERRDSGDPLSICDPSLIAAATSLLVRVDDELHVAQASRETAADETSHEDLVKVGGEEDFREILASGNEVLEQADKQTRSIGGRRAFSELEARM